MGGALLSAPRHTVEVAAKLLGGHGAEVHRPVGRHLAKGNATGGANESEHRETLLREHAARGVGVPAGSAWRLEFPGLAE